MLYFWNIDRKKCRKENAHIISQYPPLKIESHPIYSELTAIEETEGWAVNVNLILKSINLRLRKIIIIIKKENYGRSGDIGT